MLFTILTALIIIWVFLEKWKARRIYKLSQELSNEYRAYPLIGHAYMFLGSDEDRMSAFQKFSHAAYKNKHGVTGVWTGLDFHVLVANPEVADIVMKTFLEKADLMKVMSYLTENGSVFAPVSIWRPRRKVMVPIFAQKYLNRFVQIFAKKSQLLVDLAKPQVNQGPVSVWPLLTAYTMDSVCETALGIEMCVQTQSDQTLVRDFDEFCEIAAARICKPWLANDTIFNMLPISKRNLGCKTRIRNYVKNIVLLKQADVNKKKINNVDDETTPKSALELLLEENLKGAGFSVNDLVDEIMTLVLAGTDTSAVGTSFALVLLSRHPEIQEKVYQEIKEVFGDSDRPADHTDLLKLKYLEAVFKETLRLYCPVPLIMRKVDKDIELPSGLTLIEGTSIMMCIWGVHHNPKYWGPDVEEFKPERFLNGPLPHHSAFMAFSIGQRNCLGFQFALMSAKTVLSTILRNYKVLPVQFSPDDKPTSPLRVQYDMMMRHVNNYKVELQNRR